MIYKSLLSIIITLLVIIVLTTYLISYVNDETSRALTLENTYLLSINVFKQLNNTLPQILHNDACQVIVNPMNYSCNALAENLTNTLNDTLNTISNGTGYAVRYEIINYEIYGKDNETVYSAIIQATTQSNNIRGTVVVTYPFNLCYYAQVINGIASGMKTNVTIQANNITEAVRDINRYLAGKVNHEPNNINITLYYVGVFQMIRQAHNYTVYKGTIDYTLYASPSIRLCNVVTVINGNFHVVVLINMFVNNTYYFTVNGIINNEQ
ncbi:hypothetical protein [Vulcanisaeta sp. JCM 16159]|uniref:hypothetical protein n=1 Tax=Vulcanisaeta sp. JCM 16159 TaxID=1295371 RepID=UPI0006CF7AF4|nr:hypothetical protein [Vulcanisaeta sp. JCM 16159]